MEAAIVTLSGDIDVATRISVREQLEGLEEATRAIVDLTNAEYIDSSGVSELLFAYRRRADAGVETLRLVVRPQSNVARLIELAGLGQVFMVFDTVDAARA
jgi:anti-sigma B factor antagonist